jgi:hypothetical protein
MANKATQAVIRAPFSALAARRSSTAFDDSIERQNPDLIADESFRKLAEARSNSWQTI